MVDKRKNILPMKKKTYMSTPENVKDFERMGHMLKAQRPNYDKLKQSGGDINLRH